MLKDIRRIYESQLGTSIPDDIARRIDADICRQLGGESHYLPRLPERVTKAAVIAAGTAASAVDVARQIGCTVRYVRKVRRVAFGQGTSFP